MTPKFTVTRGLNVTTVKCELNDGHLKVSYTIKSFESKIEEGVAQSQAGAESLMAQLKRATT